MNKKRSVKDYQFGNRIGEGSYSTVYSAVDLHNRKTYAIKMLSKKHIVKENKIKYVNIEKHTLNRLGNHPGIVQLYYTFQDEASLYFVIDFAEYGELLSIIRKYGSLNEQVTKFYMIQIIDAVNFMHSKGVIHRDLKPENILVDHDLSLKITDFGAAKLIDDSTTTTTTPTQTTASGSDIDEGTEDKKDSFVGTAEYVSPELLKFNKCGFECDIWAIGCILYQLIVGVPPFKGKTEYLTFEKIIHLDFTYPNYYIPPPIKHLVNSLLILKPEDRYTIPQIKSHEFFLGVDWNDENFIWKRKVPKYESYNPKIYQRKNSFNNMTNNLSNNLLPVNNGTNRNINKSHSYQQLHTQIQQLNLNSPYIPTTNSNTSNSKLKKSVITSQQITQQISNKFLTDKLIAKNQELNLKQNLMAPNNPSPNGNGNYINNDGAGPNYSQNLHSHSHSNVSVYSNGGNSVTNVGNIGNSHSKSPTSSNYNAKSSTSPTNGYGNINGTKKLHPYANLSASKESYLKPDETQPKIQPPIHTKLPFSEYSLVREAPTSRPPPTPQNLNSVTKVVPSEITSILRKDEIILKLDNIYSSELLYRPKEALNDKVINGLIVKHENRLSTSQRISILIITNLARLFIFSSDLKKYVIINLTNKYYSMYDYEFNEEEMSGYLIIELIKENMLIFLKPSNESGDISNQHKSNSNFKINENSTWIDCLLKAKDLINEKSDSSNTPSPNQLSSPPTIKPKKSIQSNISNSGKSTKAPKMRSTSNGEGNGNGNGNMKPNSSSRQNQFQVKPKSSSSSSFAAAAAAAAAAANNK